MSFFVSLTPVPYPVILAPKAQATGDRQRRREETDRRGTPRAPRRPVEAEASPGDPAARPSTGTLLNVRV
jgi:hypothetical protein